ncbi:helix-turn-helix transcriptional regulator (plasmid) [Citricoccus nitrophenolicus]
MSTTEPSFLEQVFGTFDDHQLLANALAHQANSIMIKLRQARDAKQITDKQIAEKMAVSVEELRRGEAHDANPSLAFIRRYALAIGVLLEVSVRDAAGCEGGCAVCTETALRIKHGDEFWQYRGMDVCPQCGNKRCPRADHHDYVCTGSNEPGQTPVKASSP